MGKINANYTYTLNGVKVSEKIIPDNMTWTNATQAANAGFKVGSKYKACQKLSANSGKVQYVTIHNTNDLAYIVDDAEQYVLATYNESMLSSRVHFYVDENGAWQTLRAGTGLSPNDPVGSAEVGWHSGDGVMTTGGNQTSLSLEIIMGESTASDKSAYTNGAKIAAWLLWKNNLPISRLVSHTYWVNKLYGKTFSDVDEQCTNLLYGLKWCPAYIFASQDHATALKNWKAFKATVNSYLTALSQPSTATVTTSQSTSNKTVYGEYSDGSDAYASRIWDYFYYKIGNEYGVAGLMGNIKMESNLRSNNMEDGYESKLGFTDVTYTKAVDNGTYSKFATDGVGYGLVQWTWWTLKRDLLAFCKERGTSVGDFSSQLDFLYKEFENEFPNVLKALKNAKSVREASDYVLLNFERPADTGTKMQETRANFGMEFYNKFSSNKKKTYKDTYISNGYTFRRCKKFWIVYHDAVKTAANYGNYCNAGFFGNYANASGKLYTLPVANLVCDPWSIPPEGSEDVKKHLFGNKLRFSTKDPHTKQFQGKSVSTLIVPKSGTPYVAEVSEAPADCLYAISGVPVIRKGEDVSYNSTVKAQGWDDSPQRATYRNWLGIRDGEIWLITGSTTTPNYISKSEFYNKVKGEGFSDVIALDGGGSYIYSDNGTVKKDNEPRRVNNLIVFS